MVLKYQEKLPIYIIERKVTVEIHIQGGIVAAYENSSIFMVHSVLAVSAAGKLKRDENKSNNSIIKDKAAKENHIFSKILETEMEGQQADAMTCKTVTYGQDSRIHTFEYRTREYRY